MCAAVHTPSRSRNPVVEYGADGKLVVVDPDGTFKSLDDNRDLSSRSSSNLTFDDSTVDNRRPVDNGRVWALADEALRRIESSAQPPTVDQTGKNLSTGVASGVVGDRSGGNPRYKQRGIDQSNINDVSTTVNSNNISNASSSLLRRLRMRTRSRSRSTAKRSESDPRGERADKNSRKHGRRKLSSHPRNSFSIDKPKRRKRDNDFRGREEEVRRPDEMTGEVSQQQTSNMYWQEMINQSRRRHQSSSPKQPRRNEHPKRRASSSPVASTARSHRSNRSNGSSGGGGSRFSHGPPKMSKQYAASLNAVNGSTTFDVDSSMFGSSSSHRELVGIEEAPSRTEHGRRRSGLCQANCSERCLDRPCISGSVLVVVGCLLVAVGVVRLLVCMWHEYGNSIWAGVPLLLFGFAHITVGHKSASPLKMTVYLVLGAVTSLALLAAAAVSLVVLVPVMNHVLVTSPINNVDAQVATVVNFSRYNSDTTVTGVVALTWPIVVLDLCSLLLLAMSLYTQTITTRAFDNYLDNVINDGIGDWPSISTSQRRCNITPLDQTTIGQITVFVGFFQVTFIEYLPSSGPSAPHAWSTVWSGTLLIIAGLIGVFKDKVPYSRSVGVVAVGAEICSLLGCVVTVILTTLVVAKDAQMLAQATAPPTTVNFSSLVAIVTVAAVSDCLSVIGLVFSIGILLRQCIHLCRCCSDDDIDSRTSDGPRHVGSPSSSRTPSVSAGRQPRVTMANWQPSHATEMYEIGLGVAM